MCQTKHLEENHQIEFIAEYVFFLSIPSAYFAEAFLELMSLKRNFYQESFNILHFSINHLVENKKDSCGNIQI
jgi:hypothetical protein